MDRANWVFTQSQLEELNNQRKSTFPPSFTFEDERIVLNYHVELSNNIVKMLEFDDQIQTLCYSAQIFKRLYLRNSIFSIPQLHQTSLTCLYIALKLSERVEDNILKIVEKLKSKPKHKNFIHYGDESFAKQEIFIVQHLNYEIQVIKLILYNFSFLNTFLSFNQQTIFLGYKFNLNQTGKFFKRSLYNDFIFQFEHGQLGIAICECALLSVSRELQSDMHSNQSISIVGPSNRPVSQLVQLKIKGFYQHYLDMKNNLLLQQYLQEQTPEQITKKIDQYKTQIQYIVNVLNQTKEVDFNLALNAIKQFETLTMHKDEFRRPEIKLKRNDSGHNPDHYSDFPEPKKQIRRE